MKICFSWKNRPDYEQRLPKGLSHSIMGSRPDGTYPPEGLRAAADADAIIAAHEPVDEALLAACPKLRIVQ
ncbi:MAG TPA: hydroxyacid dehydrogenase, partial [bacterium]